MASIATLKINSYFFIALMVSVFGLFMFIVCLLLGLPIWAFIIFTIIFVLIQIAISSSVVKWSTRTRYLKPGENKFLEKTVAKLCKKAEIDPPQLGIVDNSTPNAFVYGLTQSGATLSVHQGLLEQLNKNEIEAVLAHEIGHIKNRDCMYMTFLSVIPLIAYMGMYAFFFSGGRNRNAGAMIIIGLVSILVYFLTSLLIKKISRIREYYADAYSGYLTKDPHSLASALTKITYGLSLAPQEKKQGSAARSFYIGDVENSRMEMAHISKKASKYDLDGDGIIDENELEKAMEEEGRAKSSFSGLFSTHPPTFKRILALKEMEKEIDKGQVSQDNIYEKVEF